MLKNKIALITGAARGIGMAIALEFARNNCDIVINYNNSVGEALRLEGDIKKFGRNVISVKADVSDFDEVAGMIEKVKNGFGRIDILVNNAGINIDKTLKNMEKGEWIKVINTNLNGTFNVIKNSLPLIPEGGRVINISSVVGLVGNFGQANYAASKAGIIGLTKSLAKELGRKNITVNTIAPGLIESGMTKNIPKEILEKYMERISLQRAGRVEDVANCALFLASEKASYITGEVISVDGGIRL